MARITERSNGLFLDTSYALALVSARDIFHDTAKDLSNEIQAKDISIITTRAIIFEIGNSLTKPPRRNSGIELINSLQSDSAVEIMEISSALFRTAYDLFRTRPDKEWSLTDCLSFVVMAERGLTESLTADEHFEQAGFHALLKE